MIDIYVAVNFILKIQISYFSKEASIKLFKSEAYDLNEINNFLEKNDLYAFQHKILERMLNSENLIKPASKTANREKAFLYKRLKDSFVIKRSIIVNRFFMTRALALSINYSIIGKFHMIVQDIQKNNLPKFVIILIHYVGEKKNSCLTEISQQNFIEIFGDKNKNILIFDDKKNTTYSIRYAATPYLRKNFEIKMAALITTRNDKRTKSSFSFRVNVVDDQSASLRRFKFKRRPIAERTIQCVGISD
ncbi:hypothetical protein BpHYR1_000065 [Brachionus plicatilis]|uniref:Uncharacterized protein n=1 Tax=Brachionus plicatilis TaxID=10195 RepID=A0A3M7SEP8_BRAPC|nr:hypothetical protein BpHYR1_000065 [Brachionus plicatilis]